MLSEALRQAELRSELGEGYEHGEQPPELPQY
jgi:hypothetical protein